MIIREVKQSDYGELKKLFCSYFAELDCEDDPLHLFDEYVLPDLKANLLSIAVAEEGEKPCGFIIFQVDDVINDWCFKEGDGDIREIYVTPVQRRKGIGKSLIEFAEKAVKAEGARRVYALPTDDSEKFFLSCGYDDSGEYCAELDCKIVEKDV